MQCLIVVHDVDDEIEDNVIRGAHGERIVIKFKNGSGHLLILTLIRLST